MPPAVDILHPNLWLGRKPLLRCTINRESEMQTFEASIVENIQRKSLTPLEAADDFKTCVSDIIAWVA